ncbi:MAG: hypothetical protein R3C09_15565 [Pirellulaceae bacterium]
MRHYNTRPRGLILLIVLSMLTLFSLLAISYVIFSGQSRSANFGIARRDFHGMRGGEVIDEAMKQILRGTVDNISAVGPHSLLADLYGYSESIYDYSGTLPSPNNLFRARAVGELFASRFLRIPLSSDPFLPLHSRTGLPVSSTMADEHDFFTGRVLTFLDGPLTGVSFRIVRSVAVISGANSDLQHSVVIDLDEAGPVAAGVNNAAASAFCYGSGGGYQMWINARELNGLGYGIPHNFGGQIAGAPPGTPPVGAHLTNTPYGSPLNLQPSLNPNKAASGPLQGQIAAANARAFSIGASYTSDSDEAYDAPDHNDFYLAHARLPFNIPDPTDSSAIGLPGQNIIPSFHRAALVNYIINREDLTNTTSFTQDDFINLLDDIQGACGRPLGISVINMDGGGSYFSANPYFDGSNPGSAILTPTPSNLSPVLNLDLGGRWNNWTSGTPSPLETFLTWTRWLTGGPWDVDNDGDGVNDSVWVDLDLPVITSAEGKLLKMMTAYYIEDLDNRLDLNAVGNLAQRIDDNSFVANTNRMTAPLNPYNYTLPTIDLPQGFGLGPAESSLRHLFSNDSDWLTFLQSRYGGPGHLPGSGVSTANPPTPTFDDLRSQLDGGAPVFGFPNNRGTRSRRQIVRHDQLPGLPSAVRGDYAMGFDRLGNPLMLRGTANYDQGTDDPYESRLVSTPHQDLPFAIAEWERVYRHRDWDRSSYPRRLESYTPIASHIGAVTPHSSHTRHVPLSGTSAKPATAPQITSFRELLDAIGQFRPTPLPTITPDAYFELFPLEFQRAQALDLNRPFGNGMDDNDNGSIDEPSEMLTTGNLFSGTNLDLNVVGLQKSLYIAGNAVQPTAVNEYPVFAATHASPRYYGYTYGNVDPDYEATVNLGTAGSAPVNATARDVATLQHGQQSRQLMARHLYCLAMLLLPDQLNLPSLPPNTPLEGLDRARAIAQWAVNIIDFRDADHVMTRFAYDPFPFDNSTGTYWNPNRDGSNNPVGYVVWGLEQPELLLMETGATHDLRIKDTANDNGANPAKVDSPSNPDTDYDQYRIPQGSLFLELMSPRTTSLQADNSLQAANIPSAASSLYTTDGSGNRVLNLGALTPTDGTTRYPVWRVALSEPHAHAITDVTTPTPNNILNGTAQATGGGQVLPHDVSYQLSTDANEANLNGLVYDRPLAGSRTAITAPPIDRLLWFVKQSNISNLAAAAVGLSQPDGLGGRQAIPANDRPAHVYFNNENSTTPLFLSGGQYFVVSPREQTYFGSKTSSDTSHFNEPNDHRIEMRSNWAELFVAPNTPVNRRAASMRDIVQMTAVTTPPWNRTGPWNELTTTEPAPWVGLNVSEPHPTDSGYYPAPTKQLNSADTTGDLVNGASGFKDLPFDAYFDHTGAVGAHPDTPFDHADGTPIKDFYRQHHDESGGAAGVATPGTQLDWCTAFLQRLADPDRPYHPAFNPYITVDWMPIDLTVFSGEDIVYTDATKSARFDAPPNAPPYRFGFRSKNGAIGSNRHQTFLSYRTDPPIDNSEVSGVYFIKELPVDNADNALSAPPVSLPMIPRPTQATVASPNFTTLGYLNSSFELLNDPTPGSITFSADTFRGVPSTPPANLQWNNRDFSSPYELMLVPMSAPGQLMQEFSSPMSANDVGGLDHYSGSPTGNIFAHLPNFFQEAVPNNPSNDALRHSYTAATLLELVAVPSPWSDAAKVIPPARFNMDFTTNQRDVIMLGPLMPPYNRISQMREPGRVNINTLEDVEVMRGLEWSYLDNANRATGGNSLAFDLLKASRDKSYLQPPGTEQITGNKRNIHLDGRYPTEFPGVFKSSLAAGRVTPTRIPGLLDKEAIRTPAMASLFRKNPVTGVNRPLFSPRPELVNNSVPNPQSEYLPFSRLANLTTTRSNVFAVRITVGYFEYDPSTGVGPEYGWDNGQSRRHRGFYVIDRSIPVAYEPGQDLNTGNCVLVRRIVE